MLSEETIQKVSDILASRMTEVNVKALKLMGRRIKEVGRLSAADIHRLKRMKLESADIRKIERLLSKATKRNIEDIRNIIDIAARESYNAAEELYQWQKINYVPYDENEWIQNYVESMAKQAANDYLNMSRTTAFALRDKTGTIQYTPLSKGYQALIDKAMTAVSSGTSSYTDEITSIVKNYSASGIRTVDYSSGYSRRLDTAVRANVLESVRQVNINIQDKIGQQVGADGKEISVHANPALDHADIQGQQLSNEQFDRWQKEHEYPKRQIGKLNCYHYAFSIILGVSKPLYSKSQLEAIKQRNEKGCIIDGKHYTMYEASQSQRKIESQIRWAKDKVIMAKAAGDAKTQLEGKRQVRELTTKYEKISEAAGLAIKPELTAVDRYRDSKKLDESLQNLSYYDKVHMGIQPLKIIPERQGRHILGSEYYIEGRSYFTISEEEVKKLLDARAGTGVFFKTKDGKYKNKELIETTKTIGIDVNKTSGVETKVTNFIIHYSKTGAHLVPTKEGFLNGT